MSYYKLKDRKGNFPCHSTKPKIMVSRYFITSTSGKCLLESNFLHSLMRSVRIVGIITAAEEDNKTDNPLGNSSRYTLLQTIIHTYRPLLCTYLTASSVTFKTFSIAQRRLSYAVAHSFFNRLCNQRQVFLHNFFPSVGENFMCILH